jgi:hypothetical protein
LGEEEFSGTIEEFRERYPGLEDYQKDDSTREPPPDPVPPSRPVHAKRATTYDNTFRYGVAKNGVPSFSRKGKPLQTDQGTVTLTPEEASQFFRLQDDNEAWIAYKHELYDKYRAA